VKSITVLHPGASESEKATWPEMVALHPLHTAARESLVMLLKGYRATEYTDSLARLFEHFRDDCFGLWVEVTKKTANRMATFMAMPSLSENTGSYVQRLPFTPEEVARALSSMEQFGRFDVWWLGTFPATALTGIEQIDRFSKDMWFTKGMADHVSGFHLLVLCDLDTDDLQLYFNEPARFDEFLDFVRQTFSVDPGNP